MNRPETVAASVALALIDYAVTRGVNRNELLGASGLSANQLTDRDARLPLVRYAAAMRAAKSLSGDEAFALHFGEAVDLADMSVVGLLGRSAQTASDGLGLINRYSRLVIDVACPGQDRFEFRRDGGLLWTIDTRENASSFPELTESTFARIVAMARRQVGGNAIKAVHVTHASPPHASEYAQVFRAPVTFASDRNALLFDHTWEHQPIKLQPRYAMNLLAPHAETLLEKLDTSASMHGRVESVLLPILHTRESRREVVATKLGMSAATLRRRLKSEDTTFEAIIDDLRRKMAIYYLSSKHLSVGETAYLVGFSDVASLSRAVRRWTGRTPGELRSGGALP